MSFGDSPQFIALQGVTLSNWLHVFHLFWVSFESQGFLQEEGGGCLLLLFLRVPDIIHSVCRYSSPHVVTLPFIKTPLSNYSKQ